MTTPRISIVLTSYNHQEYIGKAIKSLLNQTFKDFELIIVDDASTDGSQNIIKEFTDPRIRLFFQPDNSGNYVLSTNFGARQAKGEYIIFAQCDDFADINQLKILNDITCRFPEIGVIYSSSNLIDENDCIIENDFNIREKEFKDLCKSDTIIHKNEMQKFLLESCVIPNLSAALIKKDLYDNLNGLSSEYKVVADWDFWLRATTITDFFYIRNPLNYFRQHKTTIRSSIKVEQQLVEVIKMYGKINAILNSKEVRDISKYKFSRIWLGQAKQSPKNWIKSFLSIRKEAIKQWPTIDLALIKTCLTHLVNN